MKLSISEKVEELGRYTSNSLFITTYGRENWVLDSYGKNTLFSFERSDVRAKTFEETVNRAYKIMEEDKKND